LLLVKRLHTFDAAIIKQLRELLASKSVKFSDSLFLHHALTYVESIDVFEVRQHEQLLDRRVVAHIAVLFRVGFAPFGGGLPEQCDIQEVGFIGESVKAFSPASLRNPSNSRG